MYLPAFLQSTNCTFLLASHSLLNAHSGYSTNHINLFNFFSFLHINMNRSLCKTGCWLLLAQMFCKIVCNPFRKRPKCVWSPSLGLGLESWWCAFGLVFLSGSPPPPLCFHAVILHRSTGLLHQNKARPSLRSLSYLYPEDGTRP